MKVTKLACWGLFLLANVCLAQQYTITDLGTLGGSSSHASAINASGQVVGFSSTAGDTAFHAFRTGPNIRIDPSADDLGVLDGGTNSFANAINGTGDVVGSSEIFVESSVQNYPTLHAFFHSSVPGSGMQDLGSFFPHWAPQGVADLSSGDGINDSGQIVGSSTTSELFGHAYRTAPHTSQITTHDDIGTLCCGTNGGYAGARAINISGQAVGFSSPMPDPNFHAFRASPNSLITLATDDLGTLGGINSYANAINAAGQVVGVSQVASLPQTCRVCGHAFRTAANRPINPTTDDLGTLGGSFSQAYGINSSGQVVGYANLAGDLKQHAFLYSWSVMRDLNDLIPASSGWELSEATGINDVGQIVGTGINSDGQSHAYLLTPIEAKGRTSTLLRSTLNPSIYGQTVTFTATVRTSGVVPPTGRVLFTWTRDTATYSLGGAALNSDGVATFTRSNLNASTLPLVAVYKGDANNLSSRSTVLTQLIVQTTSKARLSAMSRAARVWGSADCTSVPLPEKAKTLLPGVHRFPLQQPRD